MKTRKSRSRKKMGKKMFWRNQDEDKQSVRDMRIGTYHDTLQKQGYLGRDTTI